MVQMIQVNILQIEHRRQEKHWQELHNRRQNIREMQNFMDSFIQGFRIE